MVGQRHASVAVRRLVRASIVGIVLLLAALPAVAESGAASASGHPVVIDIRAAGTGDLAMPFNFAVQPGHEVVLLIRNYTHELHTFAIPALGLNVAVLPGTARAPRTARVTFVAPSYGVYRWFCVPCRVGLHTGHVMGGKVYAWISPDLDLG